MKLMMDTMMRGRRSARSASIRSGNGVVNASSSATWTLSQLLVTIVSTSRTPWSVMVSVIGPK